MCVWVCVLTNFTVHRHAQLNSAAAQFGPRKPWYLFWWRTGGRRGRRAGGCCLCCRAEWQSSSSFSVIKPEQGLFFPANYVEITKTIKHLVVILSLSRFSQYCDRLMHYGWVWAPHGEPAQSWGQQRANRWIYNFAFSRQRSEDHCPPSGPPSFAVPPQRPPLILRTPKLRPACITNTTSPPTTIPSVRYKEGKQGRKSLTPPTHPHLLHPPHWRATLVKCFLILLCFQKFST